MFSFDGSLIEQLMNHNEVAFGMLYNQTVDIFFRYTKGRYRIPDAEIEDILANFYAKLRQNLDGYRGEAAFENYLWTIFKNSLKDYFKKKKSHYFSDWASDDEESPIEGLVAEEDVLREVGMTVVFEHVQEAMTELDQLSYDMIHHKFIDDKSYGEIADMYGIDQATVRQRVFRALKKLRGILDAKGLDY